jgi:hypothetical protein
MNKLASHTHECPRCHRKWECGEANYQDECPYPLETLCIRCFSDPTWEVAPVKQAKATNHGGQHR